MTNKTRILLPVAIFFIAIIAAFGVFIYLQRESVKNQSPLSITLDPRNTTYTVENEAIKLINGKAETKNGEARTFTSMYGEPIASDLNGDRRDDAIVFLTQDTGGTGLFYHVAVALQSPEGTQGVNAVFIGDRISPKNIEVKNGQIVVNYIDRKKDEPMTATPTVETSMYLALNNAVLEKTNPPASTITYLTSPVDTVTFCNGELMDSAGYQNTITVENSTSTSSANPTRLQIIKETIHAATSGMCRTVLDQLDITESGETVYIPPMDGWAGISISMCSCKPQVEVNMLRIPGITNVTWLPQNSASTSSKSDLIQVTSPQPNQLITNPLTITGKARGTWFFEASFPVALVDWDGKIIAQGVAQAQSDWMTSEFVPFTATLSFKAEEKAYSNKGALILKKDNPSGLPVNDDALEIPVILPYSTAKSPVACTMEAKQCPDGTYVGRSGPNCEFAPCMGE